MRPPKNATLKIYTGGSHALGDTSKDGVSRFHLAILSLSGTPERLNDFIRAVPILRA